MKSGAQVFPMQKLLKIAVIVIAALLLLFAMIHLSEWYRAQFTSQIEEYPWGNVNENPWYYASSTLYANVMLGKAILLLLAVLYMIREFLSKNAQRIFISLFVAQLVFVASLVSSLF